MAQKLGINTQDKMVRDKNAERALLEKEAEIEKLKKEQEQILKDEELKETKAWQLSEDLKEIKEQIAWLEREKIKKKLELNKLCTHEKVRTESRYVEGGYLDRSESWTYYYCELCGAKIDEKVSYGGFG